MAKRVLLCLSHSIEEHDQLKLFHSLGYEVASIGGYIDPQHPHDPKRPALDIPQVLAIREAVDNLGTDDNLGNAQSYIPHEVLDWLGDDGVLIYHHHLQRLFGQWDHLAAWQKAGGRIVWRTVGQSTANNEQEAAPFRARGLEIVRYSPNERNIPSFAGEDALIRFYKDPDEWSGWRDEEHGIQAVTNVTQDLVRRGQWCNVDYWYRATHNLEVEPMGPGSEEIGGTGEVDFETMKQGLRSYGAYLYTGTQPASYTLGFIEALMTGIPVVSIGKSHMTIFPYGPQLFEADELSEFRYDNPEHARIKLAQLLREPDYARVVSQFQRAKAIRVFGRESVGNDWREFLGAP
jgi:hypothetical protein